MAKAPTLPPVLHPKDEIQFVASHRPGLEDGKYTLEIQQVIESSPAQKISEKSFKATRAFWVLGPQFTLDPQVVHAVFPPAGSRGNFWNVLPHVILNRSTLPWERSACDAIHEKDKRPPWLLLLLFDQSDAPRPQQVKLGDLKNPLTTPALWPGIGELEPGQHENDKVQVIDVPWSTLKNLLPTTLADFTYRTHARVVSQYLFTLSSGTNGLQDFSGDIQQLHGGQFPDELKDLLNKKGTVLSDHLEILTLTQDQRWRITDVGKARHYEIYKPASKDVFNVYEVESERAVLIGNRLPKPGTRNVAHLISVEDRYTSTNMGDNIAFKKATVLPGKKVRLVSLKHWEFFCLDETKTFKGLLEGLNGRTPVAAIDRGKVDLPGPLTQPTVTIEPGGLVAGSTLAVVAQDSQGKILDTGQIRKRQIQNAKDASHTLANLKSGTLNGRIVDTARELLPAAHPGASHAEAPPVAVIVNGKIAPILSSGTFQHERIIEGRNQAGKAPYGLVVEAATNDGKVLASGTITVGQIQNARDDKGKKISNASSLNGQLFLESSSAFHLPYQQIDAPMAGKIVKGKITEGTLYNGAIKAALVEEGKDHGRASLPSLLIEAHAADGTKLVSGTITNGQIQHAKDAAGNALNNDKISGLIFNAAQGAARAYLKSGFMPLPHFFRQGDRSVSWYHGPLVPRTIPSEKINVNTASIEQLETLPGIGPVLARRKDQWRTHRGHFTKPEDLQKVTGIGPKTVEKVRPYIVFTDAEATELGVALPASAADALVLYDQTWGLFDVSYAAAWELGRMLTLQNGRLAVQLFNWKRSHADALRSARHLADYGYDFPVKQQGQTVAGPNGSFPDAFARWLNELTLLRHIPFNYLVPDERLLPPESLRFFTVDRVWLECLRDGAFSIGRVLEYDLNQDTGHFTRLTPMPPLSGLLICSAVVAGWPGLHVEAYSKAPDNPEAPHPEAGTRCTTVRMERLSKNVLLCLFTGTPQHGNQHGEVRMVDIHLKPETLHFGLDTPDAAHINEDDPTCLVKKLRSTDGTPLDEQVPETGKAPWIDSDTRVVDFVSLAKKIYQKLPTSRAGAPDADAFAADFALQMVAGVDLVRFIR